MGKYKNIIVFVIAFIVVTTIDIAVLVGLFSRIPINKLMWMFNTAIFFLIFFWLFIGLPSLAAYFVAFVFFKKKSAVATTKKNTTNNKEVEFAKKIQEKKQFKTGILLTIILGVLTTTFLIKEAQPKFFPYTFYSIQLGELSKSTPIPPHPALSPDGNFLSPMPSGKIQPNITASPTPKFIQTATPSPRTLNSPIVNISYPSEMQTIEFANSSQKLCVVDTPTGGNTSGLQRKHNINDTGWSLYSDIFTLCFDPKEGLNRLQLQYKNSFGDESAIYTRQFNFHTISNINISLDGLLYKDINCNGLKDSGENSIDASATINIFKIPEFFIYQTINSDGNGHYSYSDTIKENETLTLRSIPVSPSGYKSNPHYTEPSVTFNAGNKSATVDIPQVPAEFVSACQ